METQCYRTTYCQDVGEEAAGTLVRVAGWLAEKRNLGQLLFASIRDRSGFVQVVVRKSYGEAYERLAKLPRESAISLEGRVRVAPPSLDRSSGTMSQSARRVELELIRVLWSQPSAALPVDLKSDPQDAVALKYRYLQFRKPDFLKNFQVRARIAQSIRDFLSSSGFLELETPILTKSTPEGARDYLVPSRVHRGSCYALPQSPQLFKQLFMVGGVDRYYQIARCFRDEDLRFDRQPEFTQVDLEASFVTSEELRRWLGGWLVQVARQELGVVLDPIGELSYAEAMWTYGSDKPDLRFDCPIVEVSDALGEAYPTHRLAPPGSPLRIGALRLPGGAALGLEAEAFLPSPSSGASGLGLRGSMIEVRSEGTALTVAGQVLPAALSAVLAHKVQALPGDCVLVVGGEVGLASLHLGARRLEMAKRASLIPAGRHAALWVVDFPMFERDEDGEWTSVHHPFTAPKSEHQSRLFGPDSELGGVLADAYDLVINGVEIGGGSVRISDPQMQSRVFGCLRIPVHEQQARFGFFLEALTFGTPAHAGLALGLDRLALWITGGSSLREVIPFPKSARAACLMTQAPSEPAKEAWKLLGLRPEPGLGLDSLARQSEAHQDHH